MSLLADTAAEGTFVNGITRRTASVTEGDTAAVRRPRDPLLDLVEAGADERARNSSTGYSPHIPQR